MTATGPLYRRPDGIFVVPINMLKEKIATSRSFRGSAEHLQHDGEEHECAQNAAEACGEENHEGVQHAVSEPSLEG